MLNQVFKPIKTIIKESDIFGQEIKFSLKGRDQFRTILGK